MSLEMQIATNVANALAEAGALNDRDRARAARLIAGKGSAKASAVAVALVESRLVCSGDRNVAARIIGSARRGA